MDPYKWERILAYLYVIGCFSSLLSVICIFILWHHWRIVLNACAGNFQTYPSYYEDCGCFLYASDTSSYFIGSRELWCYFGAFGLILPLMFFFMLGCYHVFRVCFQNDGRLSTAKTEYSQRSNEVLQLAIEQEEGNPIPPNYWMPTIFISCAMFLYSLTHAIILTDGFWNTCKQYRSRMLKNTNAQGQMAGVLQTRLSCGAVFDFMDFLHHDLSYEQRREYQIDSGIPYYISMFGVWIACICLLGISVINIRRYADTKIRI